MLNISAPHLDHINDGTPLQEISIALDELPRDTIQTIPWPAFPYKPHVSFVAAYSKASILLKYYVHERSIRARYSAANEPVYRDSCVEFFISFNGESNYYNLEFNCIGTCLFGFGGGKTDRKMIGEDTISKIKRSVTIQHAVNGNNKPVYWELIVAVPLEAFVHHKITDIKGTHCKVNFYKCGDQSPEPHFLAWNNIISTTPNFHLPEFFGNMYFD